MPPLYPRNYGYTSKYEDAVARGRVFFAANSAAQAFSVNSATATGLILTNPITSGFNLVLLQVNIGLTVAANASNFVLTGTLLTTASANTTHTTPLIVKNAFVGGPITTSPAGALADSAATVPTPAVMRSIGGGVLAGSGIVTAPICDNIDGLIWLAPGCVISLQAMANASTAVSSIYWEERPV